MMKTALIAGSSGLIGKQLIQKLIESDQYKLIYSISRKQSATADPKLKEIVTDFDHLSELKFEESVDDVFCTLGTTIKKAGSRQNFKKVDYRYIIDLANLTRQAGASKFIVVSSMGADPKSSIFYNQVKGMTENALKGVGFDHLIILRPSLLLGDRAEFRFGEKLSSVFMKVFKFMIPDKYKAIEGAKVAACMVKMAIQSTGPVSIVESGEILRSSLPE
jgi:uncharacterized protein YbjT (DUF2867 family)